MIDLKLLIDEILNLKRMNDDATKRIIELENRMSDIENYIEWCANEHR